MLTYSSAVSHPTARNPRSRKRAEMVELSICHLVRMTRWIKMIYLRVFTAHPVVCMRVDRVIDIATCWINYKYLYGLLIAKDCIPYLSYLAIATIR